MLDPTSRNLSSLRSVRGGTVSAWGRRRLSTSSPQQPPPHPPPKGAGPAGNDASGSGSSSLHARTKDRGPVSWPTLFVVAVAAATAVGYYRIERERRLEAAMGKVVSSESDGWTPRPDYLAKRKFVATKHGWFPVDDVRAYLCFGPGRTSCRFASISSFIFSFIFGFTFFIQAFGARESFIVPFMLRQG